MRHPERPAAALALLAALTLAGCSGSTTDGVGSTLRSGASVVPQPATSVTGFPSGGSPTTTNVSSPAPGSSAASSAPSTTLDPLTGRRTALALSPGFLSALVTLRITPGLVGRATLDPGTATFDLPITGGRLVISSTSVGGRVAHDGSGLSFTAGSVKVGLTDLVIDEDHRVVTTTVVVNGTTAARSAPVLDLDANARRVTQSRGVVSITGETTHISAAGATLLNDAFRTSAIQAGTLVGSLTVTATG